MSVVTAIARRLVSVFAWACAIYVFLFVLAAYFNFSSTDVYTVADMPFKLFEIMWSQFIFIITL